MCIRDRANVTYLVVDDPNESARFSFNVTDQKVNGSFCHIASLEVYRGREQAIEISHHGFTLNDSGAIEVRCAEVI